MSNCYPYSLEYLKSLKVLAKVAVNEPETNDDSKIAPQNIESLIQSAPTILFHPSSSGGVSEEVNINKFYCEIQENPDSTSKKAFIGSSSCQDAEILISGYCYITLIRGGLILNGFSFPLQKRIPVFNPAWMPFLKLCLTTEMKGKSKRKLVHSKFPYNCVLVEGVDIDNESWFIMAEDLSLYKSEYKIHDRDSPLHSIIYLNSALICCIDQFQKIGNFEILDIPYSWNKAVESILSDSLRSNNILAIKNNEGNIQYDANSLFSKIFNSRVIVCGAKGVGKSSCMRYLINRYLSERTDVGRDAPVASKGLTVAKKVVYVIDCDIGQPEFNPPGMISLHAIDEPLLKPCYLNMRTPLLSFYLGDITTRNEPQLFSAALKLLVEKFISLSLETEKAIREKQHDILMAKVAKNSFSALQVEDDEDERGTSRNSAMVWPPLVVNTDGFVRFMGAEVLRAIVEIVEPTHILHLSTEKDRSLPALEEVSQRGGKVLTVEPGRRSPSKVAAVDLRTLRLVSYFIGEKSNYLRDYLKNDRPDRPMHTVSGQRASAASDFSQGLESNHGNAIYGDDDSHLFSSSSDGNKGRHLYIQQGAIVDSDGVLALALLHQQSFCCPFDRIALGELSNSLPFTQLLAAMNACIVGICKSGSTFDTRRLYLPPQNKDHHHIMMLPSDSKGIEFSINVYRAVDDLVLEPCVALGVVRHVDISRSNLEVITPVDIARPTSALPPQWLLAKGKYLQLPQCLMYCAGFPVHPYISGESTGEGSGQMKARTNVKRKRLVN